MYAKLTGIFTVYFIMGLGSVCLWLDSIAGIMIMTVVAIFSGYVVSQVLEKKVRVGIIITGTFAGLFVGFIMFGGAIAFVGIQSWYIMGGTWFIFMIVGEELARRYGDVTLKWSIAIMGSYLFMRGWAFFLGGYPSEMEIYTSLAAGKPVEMGFNYFILSFLFIATFTTSICL